LLAACGREGWSSLVEKRGIKEKENILQVNLSIRNSKKIKKEITVDNIITDIYAKILNNISS